VAPVELCLMVEGQEGVSWPQWRALASACERHGIGTLYRSDHYMNLDGAHPERGSLDAWATIAALAAVTTTVRLGTLVSPATFRHPSELAKIAATADLISGGRIDVGLGAGWHEREHRAHGFPFADTRTRIDVLEEQLQIVLGSWADAPFSFDGVHYQLDSLDAQPKPAQRPHPPLILGGDAGPRGSALAAAYADEYNTTFATAPELRLRRQRVADACAAAGREPIPFSLMTTVVAGADRTELRERLGRVAAAIGADRDELEARPPDGWIVGTVPEVAEQLAELGEVGVSRVMCQHLDHGDVEFVALLGDELAPLVGTAR
jgi:F420-dependent oxidoreductase-like protein